MNNNGSDSAQRHFGRRYWTARAQRNRTREEITFLQTDMIRALNYFEGGVERCSEKCLQLQMEINQLGESLAVYDTILEAAWHSAGRAQCLGPLLLNMGMQTEALKVLEGNAFMAGRLKLRYKALLEDGQVSFQLHRLNDNCNSIESDDEEGDRNELFPPLDSNVEEIDPILPATIVETT